MAKKVQKKRKVQKKATTRSAAKPKTRKTSTPKGKAPTTPGPTRKKKGSATRKATAKPAAAKSATEKSAPKRTPKLATKSTSAGTGKTTKVAPAPATVTPAAPTPSAEPLTEAQLRRAKSGLSRANLQAYRKLLLGKRAEMLGDVAALESDAKTDSGDHFSPEHMADVGSINYEQEFTLGLMESERRMLSEIDEAIMRIDARTYGVCMETGKPIGKPRLDAKPWAKYCIEVAREKERAGKL